MMRQPNELCTTGRDISNASTFLHFRLVPERRFPDTASIDGMRRLYSFSDRPGEPLIIILAEAGQAIDAGWRQKAIPIGSLLIAFSPGFVALSHVLGARQRHRMYAESEPKLLARTIGLTGFNLCRMLEEIFDEERCRSRRTRCMFSLVFVNIDRSKAYDAIYCHLATHERCSARRLAAFAVVLPDTRLLGPFGSPNRSATMSAK
ncbi:hypothetical protein [Paraburkholderia aromaticivorans]|uniref:hypothetical protein n=1 Tax=Paraburkholderia aromaticivorans TaxID=2026199 RepID=UPI0038BC6626